MSDDMLKIAQEYDSAGRLMARGFVDEFEKLAENLEIDKEAMGGELQSGRVAQMGGSSYGAGTGKKLCKGCGRPMHKCRCR